MMRGLLVQFPAMFTNQPLKNLPMKKLFPILLSLLLAACAMPGFEEPTPTATATLEASPTPSPTNTPEPTATPTPEPTATPTQMPEPAPVLGRAESNVTVRAESRRGSKSLGGIYSNQGVQIIARNDQARWFYIIWPDSPNGRAWVLADAVNLVDVDMTQLPIAIVDANKNVSFLPPFLWTVSGEPLPIPPVPQVDNVRPAEITQAVNVRVAPNLGSVTIGALQVGQVVTMTGRFGENEWVQIDFPSGPEGKGWISTGEIKPLDGYGDLPYYNILATPITPEPPTPTLDPSQPIPPTATPTPTQVGSEAEVTAQINVRVGPASTFEAIGILNPRDRVYVTGVTINGLWYQIVFEDGPDGRGWVAAEYIRELGDFRRIPYYDTLGNPINP